MVSAEKSKSRDSGNFRWARRCGRSSRTMREECAMACVFVDSCLEERPPTSWSRSIWTRLWTTGTYRRREAAWAREPWSCSTTRRVPSAWCGISNTSLRRNRAAGVPRAGVASRGRRRFCSQWNKAEEPLAISIRSCFRRNFLLRATPSVPLRPGQ